MRSKDLKPIRLRPEYFDGLEAHLIKVFRDEIYLPILKEIQGKNRLHNSYEDLIDAIASGKIQYIQGHFEGRLNAKISKELRKLGAQWDRKQGWWKIPPRDLSNDMRSAIGTSYSKFQQMGARVDKKLDSLLPDEIVGKMKLEKFFDVTLYKVNKDFEDNIKNITVAPSFTPEQRARIAAEYSNNMKLSIKKWTEDNIKKLRGQVQAHVLEGLRYESLVKTIQDSYAVSQNKAKFLARQETSLLMVKFKEIRYQSAGVMQYKWRCVVGSPNHPVRPDHQRLNDESLAGKTFLWSDPPVDGPNGQRHNPGGNYNCRCEAIPVVKF